MSAFSAGSLSASMKFDLKDWSGGASKIKADAPAVSKIVKEELGGASKAATENMKAAAGSVSQLAQTVAKEIPAASKVASETLKVASGSAGQLAKSLSAEVAPAAEKATKEVKQATAAVKEIANASAAAKVEAGGLVAKLDQVEKTWGDRGSLKKVSEVLVGGGALGGVSFLLTQVSAAAKKAEELATQFRSGEISAEDLAGQLARTVPILGDMVRTFDSVRELITGEAAELKLVNDEMAVMNKAAEAFNLLRSNALATEKRIAQEIGSITDALQLLRAPEEHRDTMRRQIEAKNRLAAIEQERDAEIQKEQEITAAAVAELRKRQQEARDRQGNINVVKTDNSGKIIDERWIGEEERIRRFDTQIARLGKISDQSIGKIRDRYSELMAAQRELHAQIETEVNRLAVDAVDRQLEAFFKPIDEAGTAERAAERADRALEAFFGPVETEGERRLAKIIEQQKQHAAELVKIDEERTATRALNLRTEGRELEAALLEIEGRYQRLIDATSNADLKRTQREKMEAEKRAAIAEEEQRRKDQAQRGARSNSGGGVREGSAAGAVADEAGDFASLSEREQRLELRRVQREFEQRRMAAARRNDRLGLYDIREEQGSIMGRMRDAMNARRSPRLRDAVSDVLDRQRPRQGPPQISVNAPPIDEGKLAAAVAERLVPVIDQRIQQAERATRAAAAASNVAGGM